jgi:murein endopeptidase
MANLVVPPSMVGYIDRLVDESKSQGVGFLGLVLWGFELPAGGELNFPR